jgi:hypothetical protein
MHEYRKFTVEIERDVRRRRVSYPDSSAAADAGLELTRFRGHLNVRYGGVYGGAISPVHTGV